MQVSRKDIRRLGYLKIYGTYFRNVNPEIPDVENGVPPYSVPTLCKAVGRCGALAPLVYKSEPLFDSVDVSDTCKRRFRNAFEDFYMSVRKMFDGFGIREMVWYMLYGSRKEPLYLVLEGMLFWYVFTQSWFQLEEHGYDGQNLLEKLVLESPEQFMDDLRKGMVV